MKVAICNVQEFNPKIGGIERVSVSLAEQLIKLNVDVIFISCRRSQYKIEYTLPAPQFSLPESDDYSEANKQAFCKILKSEHCDIFINQNAHSRKYNRLCNEVREQTQIKLISVFHFCPDMRIRANRNIIDRRFFSLMENIVNMVRTICTYWPLRPFTMYSQYRLYKEMYEGSDRVVLLSEQFFDGFCKIGRLADRRKLVAINNMLSFDKVVTPTNKQKQILFCGRMTSEKKPYRVLYAWQQIQVHLSDWELLLVGDGPWLDRLKQLSLKLKLKRVQFCGFQDPMPFYQKASILWMTSNFEGWGLVLTEAMQFGCVPIAFNSFGSISDIIDNNQSGCLVPPFNIRQFVYKTLALIQSGKLPDYAYAASRSVRRFAPDYIGVQWRSLFEQVLSGDII